MPRTYVPKQTNLTASDFPANDVYVFLEDGSKCKFRSAFFAEEGDYVAVYTEHSGYHGFYKPSLGLVVQRDRDGKKIKSYRNRNK